MASLFQRWRARSAHARYLASLSDCPACGHNWGEHGFDNDRDGMCGECAYEFEHDQRETPDPGCKLTPPNG